MTKYASAIWLKRYSYRTEETYVKLDSPFHLVSQQTSLVGNEHGRSHGVPNALGSARTSGGFDAESSTQYHPVSLPSRLTPGVGWY